MAKCEINETVSNAFQGFHSWIRSKYFLTVIPLFLMTSRCASAQGNFVRYFFDESYDSTYVFSYAQFLTTRFFFSKKYTQLDIIDSENAKALRYWPNSSVNMGVGATYGSLSLNLAYGFEFLNPERGRGDTRWLDLQSRIYGRRYIVDLYGQFYNGLFLRNTHSAVGGNAANGEPYYVREDIYLQQIGLGAMYVFNNRRFSYRASFVQNEWQRKSAGSFLLGLEVYHGLADGDSSLIPTMRLPEWSFVDMDVHRMVFFEVGPSAGYVHTLVWKQHWFFTAHAGVNAGLGWISEYDSDGLKRRFGVFPNFLLKAVAGYNGPRWFFGVSAINNSLRLSSNFAGIRWIMDTGNLRLTMARRLTPGPKTERYLRMVEDLKP